LTKNTLVAANVVKLAPVIINVDFIIGDDDVFDNDVTTGTILPS